MHLTSLTLEHFRSYDQFRLDLSDRQVEVFVGPNGSGKTNLVEAVSILSTGHSCLGADVASLIRADHQQTGMQYFRVRAEVKSDADESSTLECAAQLTPRVQRASFINDVRTPMSRFVGFLPTVLFLPSDLDLFTGSPKRRRDFFDDLLVQLSPIFLSLKLDYEKILTQRNALLKRINDGEAREVDLQPWDEQISAAGAKVLMARLTLLQRILPALTSTMRSMGEQWQTIELLYLRKGKALTEAGIAAEFAGLLLHHRSRDIIIKTTTIGPHRHDWQLLVNGQPIGMHASRGQQRTALLSLLFIAMDLFATVRGERPVVLLDDVFSELDDAHQEHLLEKVQGCQVFLTSTHLPPRTEGARFWSVERGNVQCTMNN